MSQNSVAIQRLESVLKHFETEALAWIDSLPVKTFKAEDSIGIVGHSPTYSQGYRWDVTDKSQDRKQIELWRHYNNWFIEFKKLFDNVPPSFNRRIAKPHEKVLRQREELRYLSLRSVLPVKLQVNSIRCLSWLDKEETPSSSDKAEIKNSFSATLEPFTICLKPSEAYSWGWAERRADGRVNSDKNNTPKTRRKRFHFQIRF